MISTAASTRVTGHYKGDVLSPDAEGALHHRWLLAHDYALLDPTQVGPEAWKDLPAWPLVQGKLQHRAGVLPQLIDLTQMDDDARAALSVRVEQWRTRGLALFGALIGSSEPVTRVVTHVARRLLQPRPNDRRRWLLRFYDAEVFRHLLWQLKPEQLDQLLGPIDVWSWPDASGNWRRCWRQSVSAPVGPMQIDAKQWEALDRVEELNALLLALEIELPEAKQWEPLWARADALLAHARHQQRLVDARSRQLYALQALQHSSQWKFAEQGVSA